MIIHDISRSIPDTPPYEGDPKTELRFISSMEDGAEYNLSAFSMSSHTATHIDAPFHYDESGAKIDELDIRVFYGQCTVLSVKGILAGDDMERLLPYVGERLLIHGEGTSFIETSAAQVIADSNLKLIGTDAASISPVFDEHRPHRILASAGKVILENLCLDGIRDARDYTLCAFPLRLDGLEAAPCRAILFEEELGFDDEI